MSMRKSLLPVPLARYLWEGEQGRHTGHPEHTRAAAMSASGADGKILRKTALHSYSKTANEEWVIRPAQLLQDDYTLSTHQFCPCSNDEHRCTFLLMHP